MGPGQGPGLPPLPPQNFSACRLTACSIRNRTRARPSRLAVLLTAANVSAILARSSASNRVLTLSGLAELRRRRTAGSAASPMVAVSSRLDFSRSCSACSRSVPRPATCFSAGPVGLSAVAVVVPASAWSVEVAFAEARKPIEGRVAVLVPGSAWASTPAPFAETRKSIEGRHLRGRL